MLILLIILVSLLVLVKSAEVFVDQASALAKKFKVDDFLIGFTVVAFGTSLPELISSLFSAISGHDQLVISNIIGSNIANLCLIVGILAIFNSFKIWKKDIDANIPINIIALVVLWTLVISQKFVLNWVSGILLISLFLILIIHSKNNNHFKIIKQISPPFNLGILLLALIFLIFSGKICVDQIIILAKTFNISESILGYFLLAAGTSLPELVTTWVAIKKREDELALGNILGSNLFNLLFIFGISTFVRPLKFEGFGYDLIFLTGTMLAVYIFAVTGKKYSFSKKEGLSLLFIYFLFMLLQFLKLKL
ncbi:MAG TPA: hypothetical protein DEP87_04245 [Candidatus Pacebacteria bacterium]|nr:hypothetical protein [Candidatus Paceibacterota bacterium]